MGCPGRTVGVGGSGIGVNRTPGVGVAVFFAAVPGLAPGPERLQAEAATVASSRAAIVARSRRFIELIFSRPESPQRGRDRRVLFRTDRPQVEPHAALLDAADHGRARGPQRGGERVGVSVRRGPREGDRERA